MTRHDSMHVTRHDSMHVPCLRVAFTTALVAQGSLYHGRNLLRPKFEINLHYIDFLGARRLYCMSSRGSGFANQIKTYTT